MFTTLIDADVLAEKLAAGNVVVLDCRFSLADVGAGAALYRQTHLPGAHYVHLDNDLSSPVIEGQSSRHPLPTQADFIRHLRRWGVNDDTQVVVYDDAGGAIAARAWWMCLWVGHQACAVLNGGFNAWSSRGLPLSTENPAEQTGTISLRPPLTQLVHAGELLGTGRRLIDARAAERYRGEVEPLDKVAGHIPGALNLPFNDNLDKNNEFLPSDQLSSRFNAAGGNDPSLITTHYCGSGVTAAHNILAMLHAGLGMSALYAGSWSEWVQDSGRPVAQGVETDSI